MQSGSGDVVATKRISVVISAGLDEVDFAGKRPCAVCVVDGQEPDCWPDPVAL